LYRPPSLTRFPNLNLVWLFVLSLQMPPVRKRQRPRRFRAEAETPETETAPSPPRELGPTQPLVEATPPTPANMSQHVDPVTLSTLRAEVTQNVLRDLANWGVLPTQAPAVAPAPTLPPMEQLNYPSSPTISQLNAGQSLENASVSSYNLPAFKPASLPLGATVPPRVKSKIWAGEFIDLPSLTHTTLDPPLSLTLESGQSRQTVAINQQSKSSQPNNIEDWTDLFHIFIAIFTERHPHQAPLLLKYCSTIRSLSRKCSLQWWSYYDTQFRRLKAQDSNLSWGETHHELYLHCLSQAVTPFRSGSYTNRNSTSQRPQQRRGPAGYCWKQLSDGRCGNSNCRFKHVSFDKQSSNQSQQRSTPRPNNSNQVTNKPR